MRHGRLPSSAGEIAFLMIFGMGLLTAGVLAMSVLAVVVRAALAPETHSAVAAGLPGLVGGFLLGVLVAAVSIEADSGQQEVEGE